MKTHLITLLYLLSLSLQAQDITPYAEQISLEHVKEHVYTLASPEMMGRNTGEKGQKSAAQYISNYFRINNIDSLGFDGYYQNFNLIEFQRGELNFTHTYYFPKQDSIARISTEGYGIATSDININTAITTRYLGYGNYTGNEDLSNEAILMITNGNMDDTYEHIHRLNRENNAQVFFIGSEKSKIMPLAPSLKELNEAKGADEAKRALGSSTGKYLEQNCKQREELIDKVYSDLPQGVIVNYLTKWGFRCLMGQTVEDLKKEEDKRIKGKDFERYLPKVDTIYCDIKAHSPKKEVISTENIIAFVEGTDLKNEVVVITGHYDHVGTNNDSTINYGADDNASGTTAIMEIAKAFQQAANDNIRPRRSVMFVAFSGEEMGLRGSHYFVDNCPVSLDSIILCLNLDMIGRNAHNDEENKNTVYVITKGKHDGFTKRTTKRMAKDNDSLIVSTHPGFSEKLTWSFSSDHFRFHRKGIPIACLFTGLHPDYHTPRDTPDKINYEKLTEICKLSTLSAWEIANSDKNLLSKRKSKKPNLIEKILD